MTEENIKKIAPRSWDVYVAKVKQGKSLAECMELLDIRSKSEVCDYVARVKRLLLEDDPEEKEREPVDWNAMRGPCARCGLRGPHVCLYNRWFYFSSRNGDASGLT